MASSSLLILMLLSHPDLDEGRVAFSAMKYRAAVPALTRVTGDAAATDPEVQEALTLLARAHLALKAPAAAQAAFEALLRRAPMVEAPAGNPALRATFEQAKLAVFPRGTVRLQRRASGEDTLLVDVINPWRLELVATWQQVEPVVLNRPLVLENHQLATSLPAGSAGYLELTKDGQVVAALGSRLEPLRGPPAPAVPDAPKAEVAPSLVPASPVASVLPPPLPPPVDSGSRRIAGWTLVGVGLATTAVGAGVIGWGADDRRRGDGFPFTVSDLTEAENLIISGDTKLVAGSVVGGTGLTAAVIGAILLLTQ